VHGCPWNQHTTHAAARNGHFEVFVFARLLGCEWSEATCWAAANGGHLAILRWAREHDCPWNKRECERAWQRHPQTLSWVRAQPPDAYAARHHAYIIHGFDDHRMSRWEPHGAGTWQ
jgi:hypothetical protein